MWPLTRGVTLSAVEGANYNMRHKNTSTLWAVARGAYDTMPMWAFTVNWPHGAYLGPERLTLAFDAQEKAGGWSGGAGRGPGRGGGAQSCARVSRAKQHWLMRGGRIRRREAKQCAWLLQSTPTRTHACSHARAHKRVAWAALSSSSPLSKAPPSPPPPRPAAEWRDALQSAVSRLESQGSLRRTSSDKSVASSVDYAEARSAEPAGSAGAGGKGAAHQAPAPQAIKEGRGPGEWNREQG